MEQYKKVVEHIFSNWTGLQLAVEHSMGGTNSKQVALDFIDYIANYCISEQANIEVEDIADVLEDVMDQEFNTVCEDDSIKDVSNLLYRFLQLLKNGNVTQFEFEYSNLPTGKQWLSQSKCKQVEVEVDASRNESESETVGCSNDEQMELDLGWTEVKTRRKK